MTMRNTPRHYGGISKTFHWLTALLILTLIPLGWYANQLPFAMEAELIRKAWMFSLHKTLGVSAFFVALLRILWALGQIKPQGLHRGNKAENFAADLVHWLLYGALVIVPLSGWIAHAAAAGFAPIWWPFGQGLPLVPKSTGVEHIAGAVHWVATKILILALLLHIAGALKHHVIDRDATLRRMLPGTPDVGDISKQPHNCTPLWAAVALWVVAIGAGAGLARNATHETPDGPTLAAVSSQWLVETGEIGISVTQFGNAVSGSFAEWTTDIRFDETIAIGKAGAVTVVISIPSLTLGSVTDQALGADFLDSSGFAQAVFMADIMVASDGYVAQGTLQIKDTTLPARLPFALKVIDGRAEMRGTLTLDRRDFAVGNNIADPGTLDFPVNIKIALKAVKNQTP